MMVEINFSQLQCTMYCNTPGHSKNEKQKLMWATDAISWVATCAGSPEIFGQICIDTSSLQLLSGCHLAKWGGKSSVIIVLSPSCSHSLRTW